MLLKRLLAIISILLLAGCAAYQPRPISPADTLSSFEMRTLDNPHLKEYMEKNLHREITPWPPREWDFEMLTLAAFYYHPDLDVARAKWGVAEAGVLTAGGVPNPGIGFTPEFNANAANGVSPWTLGFNLDIPIETAGKRGLRINQAKRLSEASRLNIAGVAWQVRSRLRTSLLDLYADSQAEVLLKKQQSIQEEIVRLLEKRLEVGEASQPDLTEAHISLDRTRLLLQDIQKQKAEAQSRLAGAIGLPVKVTEEISISFESFDSLDHPSPAPNLLAQDIRQMALLNRTDILSSLEEYAAAESNLQLEIARQYPDIHIGPGYSWDAGDNKWSIGFSLTLPVFNRNQGPITEAEAKRKEAEARFTALQAHVIGEIDRAIAGYKASLQKIETADKLMTSRKKQLQSVQSLFDAGEADRLELGSNELELTTAEISRLDSFVELQQSLGLLEDAIQQPFGISGSLTSIVPEVNPRIKEERQ